MREEMEYKSADQDIYTVSETSPTTMKCLVQKDFTP
jgi:hypothetical protein